MNLKLPLPFTADRLVLLDKEGAERLIIAIKATYAIAADGKLTVAEKQRPVNLADTFRGDPATSSIVEEAEMLPPKPATDVVLVGSARAPNPRTQMMDVSLKLGPLAKTVRVFGDRGWDRTLGMVNLLPPRPFESIPLCYENAFGGRDTSAESPADHEQEDRNPVGKGFRAKRSKAQIAGTAAPNIEDPKDLVKKPEQRPAPQGFGFMGRSWAPRPKYAGTYDGKWQEERMPLLPLDFDTRFYNGAHPDLIAPSRFKGGEPVLVEGCTPSGRITFNLPAPVFEVEAQFRDGCEPVALSLDTILIDTDAMELRLLFKGDHMVHRKLVRLTEIRCRCVKER